MSKKVFERELGRVFRVRVKMRFRVGEVRVVEALQKVRIQGAHVHGHDHRRIHGAKEPTSSSVSTSSASSSSSSSSSSSWQWGSWVQISHSF